MTKKERDVNARVCRAKNEVLGEIKAPSAKEELQRAGQRKADRRIVSNRYSSASAS
jgi:hypothetical protein